MGEAMAREEVELDQQELPTLLKSIDDLTEAD